MLLVKNIKKKLDKRLYDYSPEIVINKTDEGFIEFVEKFYKDIENYFSKYPKSKFIRLANENKYNLIITPHIGGMSIEGQTKAYTWAVKKFNYLV